MTCLCFIYLFLLCFINNLMIESQSNITFLNYFFQLEVKTILNFFFLIFVIEKNVQKQVQIPFHFLLKENFFLKKEKYLKPIWVTSQASMWSIVTNFLKEQCKHWNKIIIIKVFIVKTKRELHYQSLYFMFITKFKILKLNE